MPQTSIPYAIGRIGVLQREALDSGRLERLIAANSLSEAQRALTEIGWAGTENLDYERLSIEHIEKACALVKAISPMPELTDCYLLRYDIHNIKTLIKARQLNQKVDFLSDCGTIPVSVLEHAVIDHAYQSLPEEISGTLTQLEKQIALKFDPFEIDLALDQCMYRIIFSSLEALGRHRPGVASSFDYFNAKADLLNGVMLLRIKAMGKDMGFYSHVVIPYGMIDKAAWLKAFEAPERLAVLLKPYGREVGEALQKALQEINNNTNTKLPELEKAGDNYLLSIFVPYRLGSLSIEPVIGYLLGSEREAAAVRLIMAAKANNFSQEAIRERMRDLYGG